jgi:hypothetical protein
MTFIAQFPHPFGSTGYAFLDVENLMATVITQSDESSVKLGLPQGGVFEICFGREQKKRRSLFSSIYAIPDLHSCIA